ncbi:hypothetical protein ACFX58_14430 [Sphingomonas sp. NCPPB 2930]
MDPSNTKIGARPDVDDLPTSHRDLIGPDPTRGQSQTLPPTAKQHRPHHLNETAQDRRPPQDPDPDPGPRRSIARPPDMRTVRGEREWRSGGATEAATRGRRGHAGAGVSGDLAAGVRGGADMGRDPQSYWRSPPSAPLTEPLLALNGEASAGARFDQYAQAGLPPLRLADETVVEEPLGLGQNSHGFVGARTKAGASLGPTHAQAHAEAFAGARTGGQAHLTVGDQRFKVGGDLQAGVGLDGALAAGLRRTPEGRTRLKLEGRIGGALGIGGSVGGGMDLDVTPAANAVNALPRRAGKGAKSVRQSFGRVGEAVANAGKAAVQVAKEVVTAPVRLLKSLFS